MRDRMGKAVRREQRLAKTLKYLKKAVFSRLVITVLLVLAQIFFLGESFYRLKGYWSGISVLLNLLSAVLVVYIINRDQNPAFKLTWVIPICISPMLGALLYFWVETNLPTKGIKQEVSRRAAEAKPYLQQDEDIRNQLNELSCSMTSVSRYAETVGNYPTFQNTEVTYFGLGEEMYRDMLIELEKAEKYILMEYFIISEGVMWNGVLEILKRKIAAGVEVKLLYDGVCALYYLPYGYQKKLIAEGVDTRVFVPVIPIFSTHQNNRDHRKIMVIDGKAAYTGGINLADEYINRKTRLGHWKDNGLKLQGDAVKTFTLMFLQMWNVSNPDNSNGYIPGEYLRYLPELQDKEAELQDKEGGLQKRKQQEYRSSGYVMPYGDGPNSPHNLAENIYLDMINRSNRYIHVMTPYFIVDQEMLAALKYAAERGNDVRIIIPHIPDKLITFDIARTFYPSLLHAGVRVYEYTPGFIHAKTVVSDDNKAVVGSVNMDFRSLYHHYECGVYLYLDPAVQEIEADFQRTMQRSQEVTIEYYRAIPWYRRLSGYIFKLFAPLL